MKCQEFVLKLPPIVDVSLMYYLVHPDLPADDLSSILSGLKIASSSYPNIDDENSLLYISMQKLRSHLNSVGMMTVFSDIECPLLRLIFLMEKGGIKTDKKKILAVREQLDMKVKSLTEQCQVAAGRRFSLNSSLQLSSILYDELELQKHLTSSDVHCSGLKKSLASKSTKQEILEILSAHHTLPRLIMQYRKLAKIKSTCCDGFLNFVENDGYIRPVWDQKASVSGRLYSSMPNLQGIPREDEDCAESIRSCFIPSDGHCFLSIDFQHIELRLFAHLACDQKLIYVFRHDRDVFKDITSEFFNKPVEDVSVVDRNITKRLIYATLYGAGSQKLLEILTSVASAEEVLRLSDMLRRNWTSPQRYFRHVIKELMDNGYVKTLRGRCNNFPDLSNATSASVRHRIERQAVNFTIQGSAADLCKQAMIGCWNLSTRLNLCARLVLQLHDELVWEVPAHSLSTAAKEFSTYMEGPLAEGLLVPLRVRVKSGSNLLLESLL